MIRLPSLAVLLPVLLCACSGTALIDAVTPVSGYRLAADLPFAEESAAGSATDPRLRLDLYRPERPLAGAPAILFFYGGNWETGEKEQYRFVAQALAARGYTVAVPNYRLYPGVRYPAFLEDAAAAVAWMRRHGAEHGAPAGPVVVMGHSAGAYNALMLALDRRWLGARGLDPATDLRAAIGLAGPYDFLPLDSGMLEDLFGPEEQRPDTQPINHVTPRAPPLFLATGTGDTTVRPGNTRRLTERVRQAGGTVSEVEYEGLGHVRIIAAFAPPLRWLAPVLDDVDRFLKALPPLPGN